MRTRTTTALVAAAAVGLAACGDRIDMPLGTTVTAGPDTQLALQVSDTAGTTNPVYVWSGPDAVELEVVRLSDGLPMWRIEAIDRREGFDGPVQHGVVPTGARQSTASTLLEDEEEYALTLTTVEGDQARVRFNP